MTSIDIDRLAAILRAAARQEIMPRFRRLAATDIRQKTSATDLVTEADEAAERFIRAECLAAWPSATFVGEESVAADPTLLDRVGGAEFAIVVDPIDGTANFASGAPLFAVMAAVIVKGEAAMGLIYDPLGDDCMLAERGSGAVLRRADGSSLPLSSAAPVPVNEMVGVASASYFPEADRRRILSNLADVRVFSSYRCAGHEYRLAASGHLHFFLYHKLMPWDHLPGSLIFSEAGGYVTRLDGSPYRPGDVAGGILGAPDEESWQAFQSAILEAGSGGRRLARQA